MNLADERANPLILQEILRRKFDSDELFFVKAILSDQWNCNQIENIDGLPKQRGFVIENEDSAGGDDLLRRGPSATSRAELFRKIFSKVTVLSRCNPAFVDEPFRGELNLLVGEHLLAAVPSVDGIDDASIASPLTRDGPVNTRKQLHAERGLESLD